MYRKRWGWQAKLDCELARNARKMEAEAEAAWLEWMFGNGKGCVKGEGETKKKKPRGRTEASYKDDQGKGYLAI